MAIAAERKRSAALSRELEALKGQLNVARSASDEHRRKAIAAQTAVDRLETESLRLRREVDELQAKGEAMAGPQQSPTSKGGEEAKVCDRVCV